MIPSTQQVAQAQQLYRAMDSQPDLKGRMSPEAFTQMAARGIVFGTGASNQVETRAFPYGYKIDSGEIDGVKGFYAQGPFGLLTAIYLRNPLDVTVGFRLGDAATAVTCGPESQRRLEFDTPLDANGSLITQFWVCPELYGTPTNPGTVYFEVEP